MAVERSRFDPGSWILDGSGSVTLDGNVRIGGIAFDGTTPFTRVPDTGSTLVLLSFAVLLASAPRPVAVLLLPVVLLKSASAPLAVLNKPVALLSSADEPVAVLLMPVVSLNGA